MNRTLRAFPAVLQLTVFACLFLAASMVCAQIIPADRLIDWSGSGLEAPPPVPVLEVVATDFGAVGDGVADDRMALLNAMAALGGAPGIVYLPTGQFRVSHSLPLPSGTVLRGAGADSTRILLDLGGTGDDGLVVSSFDIGSDIALVGAPVFGSERIRVADASTLAPGDWVEIVEDNGIWDINPAGWAAESMGHIARITAVAGDSVVLSEPFRHDLDAAANPRLRIVKPKQDVGIECLAIERLGSGPTGSNIFFYNAVNCWVRDVDSYKSCGAHVLATRSSHLEIAGNYFHEAWVYDGSGTRGYGVCLTRHTTSCRVEDNVFRKLRHAMMVKQGANGNVFADNYSREPNRSEAIPDFSGDISLHGHFAFANLFEGNIVQNIFTDDYWGPSGPLNTFYRNRAELYGVVSTSAATNRQTYGNNEVPNTGSLLGNYYLLGTDHLESGNVVQGVLTPPGTVEVARRSLFRANAPGYWDTMPWPAIGNSSGQINPAQTRWAAGVPVGCSAPEGCGTPNGLMASSITTNSALVSWNDVPGATRYQLRGRPVGAPAWATTTTTVASRALPSILNPGTTYEWQVRARCVDQHGAMSDTASFTTSGARIGEYNRVYPNPATTDLRVEIRSEWTVTDLSGRRMARGEGPAVLDVRAWPSGIYLLQGRRCAAPHQGPLDQLKSSPRSSFSIAPARLFRLRSSGASACASRAYLSALA